MKPFIAIFLLGCCTLAQAEDTVWKARVTVEDVKGNRVQTVAAFLPSSHALLPLWLGSYGPCTITIRAEEDRPYDPAKPPPELKIVNFLVSQIRGGQKADERGMQTILDVRVPLVLGKDIPVLKTAEGTLTVRLSATEEKE